MKKRIFTCLLAAVLLAASLSIAAVPAKAEKKLNIIVTIFPEYDWVLQLLGQEADRANVKLLLDNGVDLHSYQPSVQDIVAIAGCDLFIYVGGESDSWVKDALAAAANPDRVVLDLLALLGDAVREEETVAGMTAEEACEEEEAEYDEHVWLSLRNAQTVCRGICDALCTLDPEKKDAYDANAESYIARLQSLDDAYREAVSGASGRTLLFGDRFPFRYLTDDYGLSYYAAFSGCSAETEASFETIIFLAQQLKSLQLPAVLTLEQADTRIAQTIIQTAGVSDVSILSLDSMQARTTRDIAAGVTYLSIMEKNLETLREALQ